jgi:hypothetical protein
MEIAVGGSGRRKDLGEAYPRGVAPLTPMRHVMPIVCQSVDIPQG